MADALKRLRILYELLSRRSRGSRSVAVAFFRTYALGDNHVERFLDLVFDKFTKVLLKFVDEYIVAVSGSRALFFVIGIGEEGKFFCDIVPRHVVASFYIRRFKNFVPYTSKLYRETLSAIHSSLDVRDLLGFDAHLYELVQWRPGLRVRVQGDLVLQALEIFDRNLEDKLRRLHVGFEISNRFNSLSRVFDIIEPNVLAWWTKPVSFDNKEYLASLSVFGYYSSPADLNIVARFLHENVDFCRAINRFGVAFSDLAFKYAKEVWAHLSLLIWSLWVGGQQNARVPIIYFLLKPYDRSTEGLTEAYFMTTHVKHIYDSELWRKLADSILSIRRRLRRRYVPKLVKLYNRFVEDVVDIANAPIAKPIESLFDFRYIERMFLQLPTAYVHGMKMATIYEILAKEDAEKFLTKSVREKGVDLKTDIEKQFNLDIEFVNFLVEHTPSYAKRVLKVLEKPEDFEHALALSNNTRGHMRDLKIIAFNPIARILESYIAIREIRKTINRIGVGSAESFINREKRLRLTIANDRGNDHVIFIAGISSDAEIMLPKFERDYGGVILRPVLGINDRKLLAGSSGQSLVVVTLRKQVIKISHTEHGRVEVEIPPGRWRFYTIPQADENVVF